MRAPRPLRRTRLAAAVAALAVGLVGTAAVWTAAQPGAGFPAPGGGPSLTFRHLTTEQGLPNSLVFSVAQDALGFVWIGTSDGLGRYDGTDMREYRHRSDTTTVAGNEVQALAAGPGGQMWVGTSDGLSRYDAATDRFSTTAGLPSSNVLAVATDTLGGVWAGTDAGSRTSAPRAPTGRPTTGRRARRPAARGRPGAPARRAPQRAVGRDRRRAGPIDLATNRFETFRPARRPRRSPRPPRTCPRSR